MTNKDIIDIRLSQKASNVANRFKEEFFFPDAISAARFGFAYMLEKATEEDIYVWLMKSDKKRMIDSIATVTTMLERRLIRRKYD